MLELSNLFYLKHNVIPILNPFFGRFEKIIFISITHPFILTSFLIWAS